MFDVTAFVYLSVYVFAVYSPYVIVRRYFVVCLGNHELLNVFTDQHDRKKLNKKTVAFVFQNPILFSSTARNRSAAGIPLVLLTVFGIFLIPEFSRAQKPFEAHARPPGLEPLL